MRLAPLAFALAFAVPVLAQTLDEPAEPGDGREALLDSSARPANDAPWLPWESEGDAESVLPKERYASAAEHLAALGIDDSHLRQFFDGRPLVSDEHEVLYRLLYRIPRLGTGNLQRWARPGLSLEALAQAPAEHRAEALPVEGRIRRVERGALSADQADLLGFDHYWLVEIEPPQGPPVIACARRVPQAWQAAAELSEPARLWGLFIKSGEEDASGRAPLYFLCDRVEWLPEEANPALGVTLDDVLLAQLGMDAGLWDTMRSVHGKGREAWNSETFYRLLAAASFADPHDLRRRAPRPQPIGPLLQDPAGQQGKLVSLTGIVRRVQQVAIDDPRMQEQVGADRYYELGVFVDLGGQRVRLGKQGPEIQNTFPIIFCAASLPPGLSVSDDLSERVRITGFYYTLWAYRSEFVRQQGGGRQISPVLIGSAAELIDQPEESSIILPAALGGLFLAAIAGIWLWVWHTNRRDEEFERRILRRHAGRTGLLPTPPASESDSTPTGEA